MFLLILVWVLQQCAESMLPSIRSTTAGNNGRQRRSEVTMNHR